MPLHRDDPRSVGGYRLVDRLGAGGMGAVYRARSRSGREVAVKVVHAQYAEDAVFRARFRQEIEAVRKVSGVFTAPVVDADPEAPRPWMATQYVPGRSLAERIRDRGALRGGELRRLALGLVEALRDIHRAGVVHRDLKPANVLMAEDGPRVIDFGISRAAENHLTLTETGQMIGTPPFMSPEQLTDARTVGPASDVFSLGALLVYATTGRGPFDADSPYLTAYRVVHDQPVLEGIGQPLRGVLERCLAKEAAVRPGLEELAREFARALPETDAGDAQTVTLRSGTPVTGREHPGAGAGPVSDGRPGRRRGRLRPLWAATGTVGALVLGLTAYLLVGPERAQGGAGAPPDGWRPWRTTMHETAAHGARTSLKGGGATDIGPDCQAYEGAVYCGGEGVLPVRLNGLTGETVWRAAIAPSGATRESYSTVLLGVRDGTMVVQQVLSSDTDAVSVVALDTRSGARLWTRPVPETTGDTFFSGDLVVIPNADGRSVTARSARTGAGRWTAPLPAGHYCGFVEAGGTLYAQCIPEENEPKDSVVLAFDAADGSTRRLAAPYNSGLAGTFDGRLLFLVWGGNDENAPDVPYVRIELVDPRTGARDTTKLTKEYVGEVTLADGTLWFASSSGEVTAVSPRTGKPLWRTRTSLEQPGEVRYDRRTRALYVASGSGRVAALDRAGTLLWETLPRVERASGGWVEHSLLLQDGALVVVTPDGTVFSLDPADPERRPASG
ncbi:serine/threonine-protein kinase [Streptomyces sp. ALI-76-A]|uniref:serine/threonine-protein kinase n=1 Tax=Streptomyces sp. ALI-76-A TaxID=3025736 RepID=UPI00256F5EFE|nr:serine/threonine-protein kinase [Streptomyces sp. ALI-76-A]MDL5201125.1 protein kinase [Streptomyces sp. ALI-76-A]